VWYDRRSVTHWEQTTSLPVHRSTTKAIGLTDITHTYQCCQWLNSCSCSHWRCHLLHSDCLQLHQTPHLPLCTHAVTTHHSVHSLSLKVLLLVDLINHYKNCRDWESVRLTILVTMPTCMDSTARLVRLSYGHNPHTCKKIKVKGQLAQKTHRHDQSHHLLY